MSDASPGHLKRDEVHGDQDEIDVELRSPIEVRTRILILASVLRRLALENPTVDDVSDLSAEAFDEREWLRAQDLTGELTPMEAALLGSALGAVAPEVLSSASWEGEALVALGWAVGIAGMPPVGTLTDLRPVIDIAPRPWDGTADWLGTPAIVLESEAAREREVAEIWYWRLTTEALRRLASAANTRDYDEAIRDVAAEARDAGLIPALHRGDFPVLGTSVRNLSQNDIDVLIAVTGQRLRALNWLCGFGDSWDDVPLDI